MNWKWIKIASLIIVGLVILIPGILYIYAIDLSKGHSAKVNGLPLFSGTEQEGEYRLGANDLEFMVRVAGMQNTGPALILLHGFPESSIMWRPLLKAASSEGYRVLAFDQRGYSPQARPAGKENYQIDFLVQDVLAIADQVGFDTFHLVGHDWGSGVGWKLTMDYPERVNTWTALSIPHIGIFFKAILNHPEQQKRSAYMNRLRLPLLPELLFQLNREKFFQRVEGVWKAEEIDEYKALHAEHGATTAALNWYRALDMEKLVAEKSWEKKITRPTLFIWGKNDGVVAPEIIPQQADFMDAPYQNLPLDAGHSLMQEKTDQVIEAILKHIHTEKVEQ